MRALDPNAGRIADPYITANKRWCEVDWLTYESKVAKGVHVLGDSLQIAPLMPKSGHMANAHGTDNKHAELRRFWCGSGMRMGNSGRTIHCDIPNGFTK